MSGFLLGVVSTLVFLILILPILSKIIMKRAIKKNSKLLLGDVQRRMSGLSKLMNPTPEETKED